jgi:hypothetical protein
MRGQIGNTLGVTHVGPPVSAQSGKIADCVADAANGFTVAAADIKKFYPGMKFDMKTRSTGAVVAADRLVTAVNRATNTVSYDGADVAATANESAYPAELPGTTTVTDFGSNINGGFSAMETGSLMGMSVSRMREDLKVADAAYYTDTLLDKLSMNDLIYNYRVKVAGGIK